MTFPIHGKNGVVKLGATGGSAKVLQLKGWSLDEKVDTVDSTVAEATAKTHVVGLPEWSASIDVLLDRTDATGQEALTIGASVVPNFYAETPNSGVQYRTGTATVESIGEALTIDGIVTKKVGLKGNGALSPPQTL